MTPPVVELPPDPKLDGWPKPVGYITAKWQNEYIYGRDWVIVGFNCYKRKIMRSV